MLNTSNLSFIIIIIIIIIIYSLTFVDCFNFIHGQKVMIRWVNGFNALSEPRIATYDNG